MSKNVLIDLLERMYPGKGEEMVGKMELNANKETGEVPVFWYKKTQLYTVYADSFEEDGRADFYTLIEKLKYIKELGCNAVHVLPFLESPGVDQGFDVSDFYKVGNRFGGNSAFERFLEKAKDLEMTVFMDLVLNHVSEEHEWFRKAGSGDRYYREFFIWKEEKPKLIKKYEKDGEVWARYELKVLHNSSSGSVGRQKLKVVELPIMFPDFTDEVPHWRQGSNGNWYFHTFYPQQIDLNWDSPEMFVEMAKVVIFWAKKGLSFRLDAARHLGKDIATGEKDGEKTHLVVRALHEVLRKANAKSVFLSEVGDEVEVARYYFGLNQSDDNEKVKSSNVKTVEVELAYNFDLCSHVWASLMTGKVSYIWKTLEKSERIPEWGQWVNFLRNHDDLKLWFIDDEKTEDELYRLLLRNGKQFAEGTNVAGRVSSFLNGDEKRIVMAHMLLASLPGVPVVYYGDELGKQNLEYTSLRGRKFIDSRLINRGWISEEQIKNGRELYMQMAEIFNKRLKYVDWFVEGSFERLDSFTGVFAGVYKVSNKDDLVVYINLNEAEIKISFKKSCELLLSVNQGSLVSLHKEYLEVVLPGYAGVWLRILK